MTEKMIDGVNCYPNTVTVEDRETVNGDRLEARLLSLYSPVQSSPVHMNQCIQCV